MNAFSVLVVAVCLAAASAANLRSRQTSFSREEAVEGYPTQGVPILPQHLDFAQGVLTSDFVFDVTEHPPNRGEAGTVQARESPNTPALQGQGIALSLFTVEEGGQNLIHYHPRATELLYVISGTIAVGFTDTEGELHENIVKAGQATVFPLALLHFQRNIGKGTAQYISILNSENPGVMSFPRVFATLPSDILAQALRTDERLIKEGQERLLPPQFFENGVNPNYDGAAGPNGNAPVPPVAGQSAPIRNPVAGAEPIIGSVVESKPSGSENTNLASLYQGLLQYISEKN